MSAKAALLEKCSKSLWKSKKGIMAMMTLACAMFVFTGSLVGIIVLHGESSSAIVNLAQVVLMCVSGTMSAVILGVNILDYKSVISLENVAKSELTHTITENITETIEKVFRPKDVDDHTID